MFSLEIRLVLVIKPLDVTEAANEALFTSDITAREATQAEHQETGINAKHCLQWDFPPSDPQSCTLGLRETSLSRMHYSLHHAHQSRGPEKLTF